MMATFLDQRLSFGILRWDGSIEGSISKSCRSFKARTSPKNYCLIRDFVYSDPLHAAAKIINQEDEEENNNTKTPYKINMLEATDNISTDKYNKIQYCINGLEYYLQTSHYHLFSTNNNFEPIGLSLLKM